MVRTRTEPNPNNDGSFPFPFNKRYSWNIRTDRRTDTTDRIPFPANAVGNIGGTGEVNKTCSEVWYSEDAETTCRPFQVGQRASATGNARSTTMERRAPRTIITVTLQFIFVSEWRRRTKTRNRSIPFWRIRISFRIAFSKYLWHTLSETDNFPTWKLPPQVTVVLLCLSWPTTNLVLHI